MTRPLPIGLVLSLLLSACDGLAGGPPLEPGESGCQIDTSMLVEGTIAQYATPGQTYESQRRYVFRTDGLVLVRDQFADGGMVPVRMLEGGAATAGQLATDLAGTGILSQREGCYPLRTGYIDGSGVEVAIRSGGRVYRFAWSSQPEVAPPATHQAAHQVLAGYLARAH